MEAKGAHIHFSFFGFDLTVLRFTVEIEGSAVLTTSDISCTSDIEVYSYKIHRL